jgi:hypothetical protein
MIGKEIKIKIGGKERKLRLSFASVLGIERDLGKDIIPLAQDISIGKIGINSLATIIYYGLKGSNDFMELEEIGNEILKEGLLKHTKTVAEFLTEALMGSSPSPGKPSPSKK